LAIVLNPRGL